ncbi:cytochrome c oxidase assembly protein [Ideonella sp.]|uniref:cytochrome c oxidase assembly protein n=1 Tax=Ideonella sp. TaxID=1929293 RepID=UPI002B45B03D|nr:cytochrome c oxidase assembly protein [Ideonella sp.]HJV68507.1 cytochrome c oxidase assembly protein [Ideonella sp.]
MGVTQANRRLAMQLALVAVFFTAFGFALVPIYDVFCRLTGLNGRTNTSALAPAPNTQVDASRWVKVEFLSHSMPGVALDLKPEAFSLQVHPGSLVHTSYVVRNEAGRVFVGQAVPSITPATAAAHFRKVECFCFSQQTLQPGEVRTMPVVFVVDNTLHEDIRTITLSYTFFEAPKART